MERQLSRRAKVKHCAMALKTADVIFELAKPFEDKLFLEDNRKNPCSLNPMYHQMKEGLLLEFWGARPVSVITPWGSYSFFGWYEFTSAEKHERDIWLKIFPGLEAQLGLVLFKRAEDIKVGTIHGDLFSIRRYLKKILLPRPIERGYSAFESHKQTHQEWAELTAQVRNNVSV